jgi:hypothetical protein
VVICAFEIAIAILLRFFAIEGDLGEFGESFESSGD